ncbi:MAG: cation diffusion facilitator family transporter [Thermoplasmata archaeon]
MRPQVVIVATLILNAVMFVANLAIALPGGSRAVLSQAIYSLSDLVAASLLLWGFFASQRRPTPDHPFGFGKERFFWAFIASFVTFTIAGLAVLVTGLERIYAPAPVGELTAGIVVLGLSLIASVAGILVALYELRHSKQTVASLIESSHIGVKTIFYQDIVSVAASVVAFVGIALVALAGWEVADGVAASVVGALLIATGFVVTAESRDLLIGKSIPPVWAREILGFIERDPRIRGVRSMQSMLLGPDDALLALRVNFVDGLTTDNIEMEIDLLAAALRVQFPGIRHIIIEPES